MAAAQTDAFISASLTLIMGGENPLASMSRAACAEKMHEMFTHIPGYITDQFFPNDAVYKGPFWIIGKRHEILTTLKVYILFSL